MTRARTGGLSGRWSPEGLRWVAWGGVVAGVVLALWPAPALTPVTAPLPDAVPLPRAEAAGSRGAAEALVRTNLFSARRQPPTVRYRDPSTPELPGAAPVMASGDPGSVGGEGDALAMPQLLGIASVEGVWQALLRWAPGRLARWCGMGARCDQEAGGGRVRVITRDAVTVEVAGQVRTVRLATRRPVDSMPRVP